MAEQRRRKIEDFYHTVLDRLGILHEGNMNYQEKTFIMDLDAVGKHIHSLVIAAGDNYYDAQSNETVPADAEYVNVPDSTNPNEVAQIKRIWRVSDEGEIKHLLYPRRTDSAEVYNHDYPDYEVIGNRIYWFPGKHEQFVIKVEWTRHFNTTPSVQYYNLPGETAVGSSSVDYTRRTHQTSDAPDIPIYADGYLLDELTARAALAIGKDPSGWMNLALRSRESMILNASRNLPRRKHVLYRGY